MVIRTTRTLAFLAAAALLCTGAPASLQATMMVRSMGLEELTDEAARIVHATVTEVRSGRDDTGVPATWISLQVSHVAKGAPVDEMTIKQFGVAEPLPDGTLTRVPGLPRYAPGDEIVLFLRGESHLGFTSPVGMGQGVYRVRSTARGTVVRGSGRKAAVQDLKTFLSTIERRAKGNP